MLVQPHAGGERLAGGGKRRPTRHLDRGHRQRAALRRPRLVSLPVAPAPHDGNLGGFADRHLDGRLAAAGDSRTGAAQRDRARRRTDLPDRLRSGRLILLPGDLGLGTQRRLGGRPRQQPRPLRRPALDEAEHRDEHVHRRGHDHRRQRTRRRLDRRHPGRVSLRRNDLDTGTGVRVPAGLRRRRPRAQRRLGVGHDGWDQHPPSLGRDVLDPDPRSIERCRSDHRHRRPHGERRLGRGDAIGGRSPEQPGGRSPTGTAQPGPPPARPPSASRRS